MIRGVVLAGGSGSRLLPLTKVTNKHLLPVGREPMVFHPLRKLVEAGITEIMVVTGVEHAGAVIGTLGAGTDLGCSLTYRVQEEAGGIAQALLLAEAFAGADPVVVLLGDNVFEDALAPHVAAFQDGKQPGHVVLAEVPDPERFGVAEFDAAGRLVSLIEKPRRPPSNWIATGVYCYDPEVFELLHGLRPSGRGELEITEVNAALARADQLSFTRMTGWWTDAGTHDSLRRANELVR